METASCAWIVVVRGEADDRPFENTDFDRPDEKRDPDAGTVLVRELTADRFVVGRSVECQLRLGDSLLGRKHLALERNGNAWEACDGGATNGTRLNGTPIARAVLREGDVLAFGTTTLRLFTGAEAEARAFAAAVVAQPAWVEWPSVATRAEIALRDAVASEIERAREKRHPLALLTVSGAQGTQFLTVCAAMLYRNLALDLVRCERDVTILLRADANEARRCVETLRRVVAVMAKKRRVVSDDIAVGIAIFDGSSAAGYRSDAASALIASARAGCR